MSQFFYIMTLTHNGKVGFGITGNVHNRIFDYIAGSAELQSFQYLYYGPKATIAALEQSLKNSWRRELWTVLKGNKWKLEVLDPTYKKTADDVKVWVEQQITASNLPIKELKAEWLPYHGDKRISRKNIELSPNMFLKP